MECPKCHATPPETPAEEMEQLERLLSDEGGAPPRRSVPPAQSALAARRATAEGRDYSFEAAVRLWGAAAKESEPEACFQLAQLNLMGLMVTAQDFAAGARGERRAAAAARGWGGGAPAADLKTAAHGGHANAMHALAAGHTLGVGCKRDPTLATQWHKKAAKNGHTGSMRWLARFAPTPLRGMPRA